MQMKARQIVVTLNLDCFRRASLYSVCVHVVWIAFLALTSQLFYYIWCPKHFGGVMSSYAAYNGELHAND